MEKGSDPMGRFLFCLCMNYCTFVLWHGMM